jgi:hypothetical protein
MLQVLKKKKKTKKIWMDNGILNGQSWPSKISFKNIDFHLFWGKQNVEWFGTTIRNGTPSFNIDPVFKILKIWGVSKACQLGLLLYIKKKC